MAAANRASATPAQQQHPHAGRAAHPVQEADAVGRQRRAAERLGMLVVVAAALVHVRVRVHHIAVAVHVGVEASAPPADQQAHGEDDDDRADRHLGRALQAARQVGAEEHDRQPEREQRGGVAEPPGQSERRGATGPAALVRQQERGDRREVIGVGGVAQSEQHRHEQHDEQPAAAAQLRDRVVEARHGQLPRAVAAIAACP